MNTHLATALRFPVSFVQQHHDTFSRIRRDLHAHPELGFEEHRTAALVAERMHHWSIEVHTGIGRTGVVGVVRGKRDDAGHSIGLRADMDALPMREENEFAHRSKSVGLMHGCGHDGHTTMLLAAAQYLAETRNFNGTVYLIFQPGEEGFGGAKVMIEDGLFERFPANEVYGQHNWPGLPAGHIGLNPGPMMAAADRIEITISGRGGHAAHPHLAVDPVLIAGHVITAAQSIVARNVAPIDAAVVSLCALQAGNMGAFSVLPREAKLIGTVRAFQHSIQDTIATDEFLRDQDGELVLRLVVDRRGVEALIAHRSLAAESPRSRLDQGLQALLDHVARALAPSIGAEDFAFMLQARPGCFVRLGQGGVDGGCWLHNSRYDFNDAVIPLGAGFLAALAERRMQLTRS
jgi:amidohydrolase